MKKLVAVGAFLLFLTQIGYCQQPDVKPANDSTLIKFVEGIQDVIEKRASDAGYKNIPTWSNYVAIEGITDGVSFDILDQFSIDDFQSITIKFLEPGAKSHAVYGAQAPFGIIFLVPKKEQGGNVKRKVGFLRTKGST